LGNGTSSDSNIPVKVTGLTGIIAVAGGYEHSLALKSDGTVWAFGLNSSGQLGNGAYSSSYVPVQVTGLSGITAIACGYENSLALKNDGTLWVWGYNSFGQLGNGTNTQRNPLASQVSNLTDIIAIAGGEKHTLVLKKDGTVWASGDNVSGPFGNGTTVASNVFVKMNSLTGITAISAGYRHSLALKNDGTLWACGTNVFGELGNATNAESHVPVQVTGLCTAVTALSEIAQPSGISVYPDPCKGNFTIDVKDGPQNSNLEIYNLMGQRLYLQKISNSKTDVNPGLTVGAYLIRVVSSNGQKNQSQRLIVTE